MPVRASGLGQPEDSSRSKQDDQEKEWPFRRLIRRYTVGSKIWYLVEWEPTWLEAADISNLEEAERKFKAWQTLEIMEDQEKGHASTDTPSDKGTLDCRDKTIESAVREPVRKHRRAQV